MQPSCAPNNVPDSPVTNTVFARQTALRNCSRGIPTADFPNLTGNQRGRPIMFTTVHGDNYPSLFGRIPHVVCLGSEKEMSRVTTGRIIATMKNEKVGRNWSVGNGPGYTIGTEHRPCQPQLAVTIGNFARLPFPALVRMLDRNPFPEPENVLLAQRRDATVWPSHDSLLCRGLRSGRLTAKSASRPLLCHDRRIAA